MTKAEYKSLVASIGERPWVPSYFQLKKAGFHREFLFTKCERDGFTRLVLYKLVDGKPESIGAIGLIFDTSASVSATAVAQLGQYKEMRVAADKYLPFMGLVERYEDGAPCLKPAEAKKEPGITKINVRHLFSDKGWEKIKVVYVKGRVRYCACNKASGVYNTVVPKKFLKWLADHQMVDPIIAHCTIATIENETSKA